MFSVFLSVCKKRFLSRGIGIENSFQNDAAHFTFWSSLSKNIWYLPKKKSYHRTLDTGSPFSTSRPEHSVFENRDYRGLHRDSNFLSKSCPECKFLQELEAYHALDKVLPFAKSRSRWKTLRRPEAYYALKKVSLSLTSRVVYRFVHGFEDYRDHDKALTSSKMRPGDVPCFESRFAFPSQKSIRGPQKPEYWKLTGYFSKQR